MELDTSGIIQPLHEACKRGKEYLGLVSRCLDMEGCASVCKELCYELLL